MSKRLPGSVGRNNLIATLSDADRLLVAVHLHEVWLGHAAVMEEPHRPPDNVYFPLQGVRSIVAIDIQGRKIEVGIFGHEGMSGTSIVTGADHTPNRIFMQVPGHALMMTAERLRALLFQSPTLRNHLLLFVQTLFIQATHTALSNGQSKLEERLARWILMCHDRVDGDRMNLTHEFLSIMLGVRRAGVTVGTHMLEGKGLIRANRGEIIVLDRSGLEEQAGGSYGSPEDEYVRLIGGPSRPQDL